MQAETPVNQTQVTETPQNNTETELDSVDIVYLEQIAPSERPFRKTYKVLGCVGKEVYVTACNSGKMKPEDNKLRSIGEIFYYKLAHALREEELDRDENEKRLMVVDVSAFPCLSVATIYSKTVDPTKYTTDQNLAKALSDAYETQQGDKLIIASVNQHMRSIVVNVISTQVAKIFESYRV